MATFTEALRRVYSDMVKRRARVRVSAPVEPQMTAPPVFLAGLYRSGTTLLRYVVDSHSRIACPPETGFLSHLHSMVEDARSIEGLESLGFDREHVIQRARVFASYFYETYAASRGKPRWADKTPAYVDHLGFLAELYPDCRVVVLLRHPLDQVHSATRGGRSTPPGLEVYREGDEDVRVAAARYWREKTKLLLDYCDANPQRTTIIGYEQLCRCPEEVLPPVFRFVGEEWEPAVLRFYDFDHDRGFEDGRTAATRGFAFSGGHYREWHGDVIRRCEEVVREASIRAGYGATPGSP
jgi:hypothetical protein